MFEKIGSNNSKEYSSNVSNQGQQKTNKSE